MLEARLVVSDDLVLLWWRSVVRVFEAHWWSRITWFILSYQLLENKG